MRRFARAVVATLAVAVIASMVAAASEADAAEHEINVSGRATLEVGQPTTVQVFGKVAPPAEYWDQTWILAVAIPTSAISGCPEDASSAGAVGEQAGTILAIAAVPHADESGNFSNVIGFTPSAPGPVLICAYLYNEVGSTWGWAGILPEVVGATGGSTGGTPGGPRGTVPGSTAPPSGAPVNTGRPWVTSRGRTLVCHPGTWSNATGGYSIRWLFDGRPTRITGPQAVNLRGNRGHKASCRVTAYGSGGSTATALSAPLRLR
jgi:hypothetical protein